MKVLLAIPPMTQFNMPYPSTAYLMGQLEAEGFDVRQRDFGAQLINLLFSKAGLARIRETILKRQKPLDYSDSVAFFMDAFEQYHEAIESVINFLKGKDPSLALRIATHNLFPEGPRFMALNDAFDEKELFGKMGTQDQAKYFASLFIDDLADVIRDGVDEEFGLSRYGEKLAASIISFTPLEYKIKKLSLIDEMLDEILTVEFSQETPDVVGLSVPFPGNLLGAFKICQFLRKNYPAVKIILGGGFVNTELRQMEDVRPFKYFDYLVFDDGEKPLVQLLNYFAGKNTRESLLRTWYLESNKITKAESGTMKEPNFKDHPGPSFKGLPLDSYINMCEMPNPMHRMWSDFRWNKMILAHGCYWKKCTFCDISLDYIGRFEPAKAKTLVDQIEKIIGETGQTGFHFVDEAAPPALLKSMAEEILKRGIKISWWGNLRFDPQFTLEMTKLMADSGCVAVTGGLEVASPRLLELIKKGITLEQVARVTQNFSQANIYVHAYLMYGFPTQTAQETLDSLEIVRQLFQEECIQSAFWHRFACTVHSPVGKNPGQFSITIPSVKAPKEGIFALNEIPFVDKVNTDHDSLGEGLRHALYNYMLGLGMDVDVRKWFSMKLEKTTVQKDFIAKHLS